MEERDEPQLTFGGESRVAKVMPSYVWLERERERSGQVFGSSLLFAIPRRSLANNFRSGIRDRRVQERLSKVCKRRSD